MSPQSIRKAQAKSQYRAFYWILALVAVAGLGALAFAVVRARSGDAAVMVPVPLDSTNLREGFARA